MSVPDAASTRPFFYWFFLFLILLIPRLHAQAPDYDWVVNPRSVTDDIGCCVATDAYNNNYVAGVFTGTFIAGPVQLSGSDPYNIKRNIFVIKYDQNGAVIWAVQSYGLAILWVSGIAVDQSGNIVIAGVFSGTLTLGSVTLTSTIGTIIKQPYDGFIAKFDPQGELVFAKQISGPNTENLNGLAIDRQNGILITGNYSGKVHFGDIAGMYPLYLSCADDSTAIFIAKYTASGQVIWAKSSRNAGTANSYPTSNAVACDAENSIYVTGGFDTVLEFAGHTSYGDPHSIDAFLLKLDPSGNPLWAVSAGGDDFDEGTALGIDRREAVIWAGIYKNKPFKVGGNNIPCSGSEDIFILKFQGSGRYDWLQKVGGPEYDHVNRIATDRNCNIYLTGSFRNRLTVGPENGTNTLQITAKGVTDVWLAKFYQNGTPVWAKSSGGKSIDKGTGIAVDANDDLIVTGYFEDLADFDYFPFYAQSSMDVFVAKLGKNFPPVAITNAWWSNRKDADHDGYQEAATLNWTVTVLDSNGGGIYRDILWRENGTSPWSGGLSDGVIGIIPPSQNFAMTITAADLGLFSGQKTFDFKLRCGTNFMTSQTPYWETGPDVFPVLGLFRMEADHQSTPLYPPQAPVALSGYEDAVIVAWKKPLAYGTDVVDPPVLKGYHIYRSGSAAGPFTKITGTISTQYFRDAGLTSAATYYYKISAVYDSGESDLSSEVHGTPQLNGYTLQSTWTAGSPVFDGVISNAEWNSAARMDITYPGRSSPVTLYVMNNGTTFFFAIDDKSDVTLDNGDQLIIFFDNNHDLAWPAIPGNEGNYWMYWDAPSSRALNAFRAAAGIWPDPITLGTPVYSITGTQQHISAKSGHVQYEMGISLGAANLNVAAGNTLGVLVGAVNKSMGDSYFTSIWPGESEKLTSIDATTKGWGKYPFAFGEIKLASSFSPNSVESDHECIPQEFSLAQNYPNPCNSRTAIRFQLPRDSHISLLIYDLQGREITSIAEGFHQAGEYSYIWDGSGVASGIYLYRLSRADGVSLCKKLVLVK